MKPLAVYLIAVFGIAVALGQQPAPNKPVPVQLKVERQNAILKLEVKGRGIQDSFSKCQQDAQVNFTQNNTEIQQQIDDGIKELGLDPATHTIESGTTFYVIYKPAPAKAEGKK